MAISIDTVYQRVLALANKEQRGYITPQEFNLFANQAQMEIFEQYFYDINQAARIPGNDYVYGDIDDMLEEKLQIFETVDGVNTIASYVDAGAGGIYKQLPDYIYRVHRVEYNNIRCEILRTVDFNASKFGGPLTSPTNVRPIVNIRKNVMRCIISDNVSVTPTGVFYSKKPSTVQWGYFVVGNKALYDSSPSKTTDFELHQSEETELVYKILKFAGVSMKREDIMRAGQGMEMAQIQQEKQ